MMACKAKNLCSRVFMQVITYKIKDLINLIERAINHGITDLSNDNQQYLPSNKLIMGHREFSKIEK